MCVFSMSGVRLDGVRPRLADTYFSRSLAVERSAAARQNFDVLTRYRIADSIMSGGEPGFQFGRQRIRVLSIFNGRQIRSTTSDS